MGRSERIDGRSFLHELIEGALIAVDARRLTRNAIARIDSPPSTVVAIGKAAPSMIWGADDAVGTLRGLCISTDDAVMPTDVDLVVGDHPTPGEASFRAGERAMETVRNASGGVLALISGGGSSLCEMPKDGISEAEIISIYSTLLDAGIDINDMNLIRRHLSAIKNGGLAIAAAGPVRTLIISDVWPHGAEVVASGPTMHTPLDPDRAEAVLAAAGVALSPHAREALAIDTWDGEEGQIEVLADARIAGQAVVDAALQAGIDAHLASRPIQTTIADELEWFLSGPEQMLVAVGEPTLSVSGEGRGGRNTHAALTAAIHIAGSDVHFAAVATDGLDGRSRSAGAIVDGTTIDRGSNHIVALESFESGSYLERTGDLIDARPTGTNVADIWIIYRS